MEHLSSRSTLLSAIVPNWCVHEKPKQYNQICLTSPSLLLLEYSMPRAKESVGPGLTKFRIDWMAFGQPESTCLNIQNVPLL